MRISEVRKTVSNEGQSTRITPNVSIYVLRYPSQTFPFYPHISTIDEAHPVTLVGVELSQRTGESHMIRTRPIRRLTRLQARQKFNKLSVRLGEIRISRVSRRTRQSRRKTRIPPKQSFVSPHLPTSRKRNHTQPPSVFPLAIDASLDGRIDVPAACEGGQRCRKVGDILLNGIGDLCGKIGGVVCCVRTRGSGEWYRPRNSRTVR